MKTIVIPIFQGSVAKNILRNDIFVILRKNPNIKIILLVPNEGKKNYFEKEFFGDNIIYEIIPESGPSFWDNIFVFLRKNMIAVSTMDIKRKNEFENNKNYLWYWGGLVLNRIFATRFFRKIIRWIDLNFIIDTTFERIFQKYNPDLILSGHIFSDTEAALLKTGKRKKIKTVGIINSWDKITTRGMARIVPDKLIVHNDIIKTEATRYLDMNKEDIEIVGIPHYDIFVNSEPSYRDDFFKKIGANPKNKIILLCPIGKYFSNVDTEMINSVSDFKKRNKILDGTELLVRFPPNDVVDVSKLENKEMLLFDQPGKRFENKRGVDWDMDEKDMQHLLDTLYYSSVVICHVSTIVIDAAIFNKPVIAYNFKGKTGGDPSWLFLTEHFSNIIKTGALRIASNKKELLEYIKLYLDNPLLDEQERKNLVKEQSWKLDGKSGKRTAEWIINFLK